MRNYFPMKTFQQDAVVRRLNVLYKLLKDIDVEYTESVATFTFDGNVTIEEDLRVKGGVSITGSVGAASATFPIINGETNPSVKPLYYHPIVIWGSGSAPAQHKSTSMSLVALTNDNTPMTSMSTFINWIEENHISYLAPASGSVYHLTNGRLIVSWIDIVYNDDAVVRLDVRGHTVGATDDYLQSISITISDLTDYYIIGDGVNKIN